MGLQRFHGFALSWSIRLRVLSATCNRNPVIPGRAAWPGPFDTLEALAPRYVVADDKNPDSLYTRWSTCAHDGSLVLWGSARAVNG